MNTPPTPDPVTDIVRYLDGAMTAAEVRRFGERLAADEELRDELRETAEQAVAMGDLGRGRQWSVVSPPSGIGAGDGVRRARFPSFRAVGWAVAASLVLGIGAAFWLRMEGMPDPIATLDFADGAVHWSGAEPGSGDELAPGAPLRPGNLIVESANGAAQMTFRDGTRLTVSGESEITVTETDRKRLTLRRGSLTTAVTPQPDDRPFTILTTSAEIEVLGTVLSVSSDGDSTTLAVDEGLVRLRRLADGSVIEVPGGHRVTATLDSASPLALESADALPESWELAFDAASAHVTKGDRVGVAGLPCLQGVPYIAGRGDGDTRVIRRGVAINSPSESEASFVQLTPDTRVRLRYRSDWGPLLFLSTQKPDGSFGGNFEYRVRQGDATLDESGWREIVVPINEFELLRPLRSGGRHYQLNENKLSKILISIEEHKRLQVAEVAIESPANSDFE